MFRSTTIILLAIATVSGAEPPSPAAPAVRQTPSPSSTLLSQLDAEVRQAYRSASQGIVRVHLPMRALNVTSLDVIRKWEPRLNDEVRKRLREEQLLAQGGSPTAYLEPSRVTRPLRIVTKDGDALDAAFVASDRLAAVTLLRASRPVGVPQRLASSRPVEGALLIAMCGDETRLLVWTGGSRESGVVVTPDGSLGVLRQGRFLGGPGYASLVKNLSELHHAGRSTFGMMVAELPPTEQAAMARLDSIDRPGLIVTKVQADRPAARAGVREGDVLIEVAGNVVPDMTALAAVLTEVRGPTKVVLGRDDQRVMLTIEAEPKDPTPATTAPANPQ
jgi:hypothetical protein